MSGVFVVPRDGGVVTRVTDGSTPCMLPTWGPCDGNGDPAELAFEFDRPTRFVDMEGDSTVLVEPSLITTQYHGALRAYLDEVRDGCRQYQTDYRLVTTDRPIEKVLGEFLLARTRR